MSWRFSYTNLVYKVPNRIAPQGYINVERKSGLTSGVAFGIVLLVLVLATLVTPARDKGGDAYE